MIEKKVLNMYHYGSRVYRTNNENSDFDFIIVYEGTDGIQGQLITSGNNSIHYYDEKTFQEAIDKQEIAILECLSLPEDMIICEKKKFDSVINLAQLRVSLSARASNSWVKANKKLSVEKDFNPYIAKKSLFHALRILIFGQQLAVHGKIIDFQAANYLWNEIQKIDSNDWNVFKNQFQSTYNKLSTEFRIVAPK